MDPYKYFKKLNQLPEEVQDYFGSEIFDNSVKELSLQYHLDSQAVLDLCFEIVTDDFNLDLLDKFAEKNNIDKSSQKKFSADAVGMIFWPLASYLPQIDWDRQITKRGAKTVDYQKYALLLSDSIRSDNFDAITDYYDQFFANINVAEEEAALLEIFSRSLTDILSSSLSEANLQLNVAMAYMLTTQKDFAQRFLATLSESTELIGSNKIVIKGIETQPTVAHWLKDFIATYGTDYYDNLKISEYIAKKGSSAGLGEKENKILSKLLIFYRNVRFFPADFENLPIEEWLIIPFDRPEAPAKEANVNYNGQVLPFTLSEMKQMAPVEKTVAMAENGLTEQDWQKILNGK